MEMIHRPGDVLSCTEVRETLSDLIDARRGEIPYPGATRLAEPGMRSAVELHVASCADCRNELLSLEMVGDAFAEFSVDEAPVQRFAEYPRLVRARLAREAAQSAGKRNVFARLRGSWWTTVGAAGVAAVLTFAVTTKFVNKPSGISQAKYRPTKSVVNIDSKMLNDFMVSMQHPREDGSVSIEDVALNSHEREPQAKKIQSQVDQYKYVVLAEKLQAGEQPLLGAYIKTTREVEQADDGPVGGLTVYDVAEGSPAQKMGLRKNDHIITVNDMDIKNGGPMEAINFFAGVRHLGKGEAVTVHVVRPFGSQWLYMKPLTGVLGE
jgi:hypothetical protein